SSSAPLLRSVSAPATISPEELNPESVAYLRAIQDSRGRGHPGIFIPRATGWFAGPRGGGWAFLLLGLFLLAGLVAVCLAVAPRAVGNRGLPYFQAAVAGLGTLLLLLGLLRFARRPPLWLPRSFVYADASYLWDVTVKQITAFPLQDLDGVDGTHRFRNGV